MAFELDPSFAKDPEKHFNTLQVHAGWSPDPTTGSAALPIYASAAFQFDDAADGAAKFALTKPGNVYGRLTNTTTDAVAAASPRSRVAPAPWPSHPATRRRSWRSPTSSAPVTRSSPPTRCTAAREHLPAHPGRPGRQDHLC